MEIIGHQKIWQFLKSSADSDILPHALLFAGQRSLGKRTLAVEFIKYLACSDLKTANKPCQNCRSCQDIQKGQHPDFLLVAPEEKEIKISQIRDFSWRLSLKSFGAEFKAAVIDQAHTMNQEAQTALLKTLEEPKGKSLLILVTEYPEMLFATITSRTQRINFNQVGTEEIKSYLKSQKVTAKEADYLSFLAQGRPGLAVNFIKDPSLLENQKKIIADLIKITRADLASRFKYADIISQDPKEVQEVLGVWLNFFRGIFLKQFSPKKEDDLILPAYSAAKLKQILSKIQNTIFLLSNTNANSRLALEILMFEL